MQNVNVDSAGSKIYSNFGEDISAATAFTMELTPKYGDDVDVTPVLETSDLNVGDEKFLANQYVSHTVTADQLLYVGLWKMKSTATMSATVTKTTEQVLFRNKS